MPKIQDIINDFNITREELAAVYKKTVGKSLTARAVNLKDEEFDLVKKELNGGGHDTPKKSVVKKVVSTKKNEEKDDAKVLKGDELFG